MSVIDVWHFWAVSLSVSPSDTQCWYFFAQTLMAGNNSQEENMGGVNSGSLRINPPTYPPLTPYLLRSFLFSFPFSLFSSSVLSSIFFPLLPPPGWITEASHWCLGANWLLLTVRQTRRPRANLSNSCKLKLKSFSGRLGVPELPVLVRFLKDIEEKLLVSGGDDWWGLDGDGQCAEAASLTLTGKKSPRQTKKPRRIFFLLT